LFEASTNEKEKMNLKKLENYINIILIIALSLVLIIDVITFLRRSVIIIIPFIREILIALGFLSIAHVLIRTKWEQGKSLLVKIKFTALAIIGIYAGYFLPKLFLLSGLAQRDPESGSYFSSFNLLAYSTLTAFLVTFFSIVLLLLLRSLIFVKRKKSTSRNFLFSISLMATQIIYFHFINLRGKTYIDLSSGGAVGTVILIALIVSFVINSFRNSWVNFLNRKNKLAIFFTGFIIVPATYGLLNLPFDQVIVSYSLTLGVFIMQMALFASIYFTFAELSVLFHLPTAGLFDRKTREISSYHELSRSISMEFDTEKLVHLITRHSLEVINADATWLELRHPNKRKFRLASSQNLTDSEKEEIENLDEKEIETSISETREHILLNDVSRDERGTVYQSLSKNIASLLAVPLKSYDKVIGILYAAKSEQYGFAGEHRDTLQAFADQATVALENARLVEESIEKERLEQELIIAHNAQMKLLPKSMPDLKNYHIDAVCVTANEVGGDYYDFFNLSKTKTGIVIGDVSGKGPEAAFHMAEIKGIVESLSHIYDSPSEILIKTNKIIFENLARDMFVTLSYGVLDTRTNTFKFARAGHCPLLYYNKQTDMVEELEPRGIGVGLEKGELFAQNIAEAEVKIKPDDILIFYTDGIIEATNIQHEEYGEERLSEKILQLKDDEPEQIKRKLIQSIHSFTGTAKPHDDLTMVILKRISTIKPKKIIDKDTKV